MKYGWRAEDLVADRSWRLFWERGELTALFAWAGSIEPSVLIDHPALIDELVDSAPVQLIEKAALIRHELIDGGGLVVISGLDVQGYHPDLLAVVFLSFGSLIGSLRSQNAAGHLLGHVTDVGADLADPTTRIYQTNHRQTFHTDSTDAVGLLCLRVAKQGGESMVVSVDAAYQRMVHQAPELAKRLFEPVATDRRGEQPDGERPWFEIPVFSSCGERVTCIYQRQYIDSAQRFDTAPKPDADYVRALDLFDEVMNDPVMYVQMNLAPGDMQFVHNHSLLHDRTGFTDQDEAAKRRHLLRVWLSLPGDRELPDVFAQRYGSITVGDRGGIFTAETEPTISFTP